MLYLQFQMGRDHGIEVVFGDIRAENFQNYWKTQAKN